jgi:hypothetical protein
MLRPDARQIHTVPDAVLILVTNFEDNLPLVVGLNSVSPKAR